MILLRTENLPNGLLIKKTAKKKKKVIQLNSSSTQWEPTFGK